MRSFLVPLFILFFGDLFANCTPGGKGGQCVTYVRNAMGGDYSKMPGLCQYHSSCGAFLAWKHWDLGYGKGSEPKPGSIIVFGKQTGMPVGHVGVVTSVQAGEGTKYRFWVNDSNYGTKERMECRVSYSYDKTTKRSSRSGQKEKTVLGFIYGTAQGTNQAPVVATAPPVTPVPPEQNPTRVNPYQNLSISNPSSGKNQPSPYGNTGYYNQGWYPAQHWGGANYYQMTQWSYYNWQLQNYYSTLKYQAPSAQPRTAQTARQWATNKIQQNTSWGQRNLKSN